MGIIIVGGGGEGEAPPLGEEEGFALFSKGSVKRSKTRNEEEEVKGSRSAKGQTPLAQAEQEEEASALFSKGSVKRSKRRNEEEVKGSRSPKGRTPLAQAEQEGGDSFKSLGLSDWLVASCQELGLARPTPVQRHCIPRVLQGCDTLGLAQTGSGKTAAFALPILQRLSEDLYGVFALVIAPTRELAFQIVDQFKALGSALCLRCAVVIGGMDMIEQAKALMQRPHVVVATPGRLAELLHHSPDIACMFKKLKFLVLDEADRVVDVGFEEELRVVLQSLPSQRQTLLFSATMTAELKAVHELSGEKAYFFEAYQEMQTVEQLQQHYLFIPENVKDLYLFHIVSSMEERGARSAIIFTPSCRTCHMLVLILEELGIPAVSLHSLKTQQQRLASLNRFKSRQIPILIATEVASRGLDIPTVDLVLNYNIPRFARDYVHRVGRTARAGRGGCAISLVTQYEVDLVHEIEKLINRKLTEYEVEEEEVLKNITKVYKARRIAAQRMEECGFEDLVRNRKQLKRNAVLKKGLSKHEKTRKQKKRAESVMEADLLEDI